MIRLTVLATLLPAIVAAEPVLVPGFNTCADERMAEGQPLGDCVRAALATCQDYPPGELVAVACLVSAKDEFGSLLGARLAALRETVDDRTGQIAEIESRYTLESSLRECDRHLELMLLDLPDDDRAAYARAQCETMAVASTLVTLILRSAPATE